MKNGRSKARADALLAAGQFRDAERVLLAIIASERDCAPAWQKLGVAYLRQGDWAKAEARFRQAARLAPQDHGAFDGMAEAYGYLGQVAAAQQAGRRALALKDAAQPPGLLPLPAARQGGARVIAYSLFGNLPRYGETAILNVREAARLFPGWACRFYIDASVPAALRQRLQAAGAELREEPAQQGLPGTMWRFLALDDPDAAAVLCRDADSLLNERDRDFVSQWLASGHPFHIIRDYFSHCELILAGLFGARGGVLPPVAPLIRRWLGKAGAVQRWTDQYFLREAIWPLVRSAALTHDPWFGFGAQVVPGIAMAADARDHVGANHGSTTMELQVAAPEGAEIEWWLRDTESGEAFCRYPGQVRDGRHRIDIPRRYAAAIQAGRSKVEWALANRSD